MTWYSGEGGLNRIAGVVSGAINDVSRVRKGWRWDTPRPASWPERGAVVPAPASDLGWARQEPVRTIRYLIQRGLLLPFTEAMAHPKVEGREWVRDLERPVIFAANHSSHADTSLILHALGDHARERTVVAAAADYWFKRPLLGNIVSLFLNTFPFSRTGGAQAQLHSSSQLLKSGWNLVLFPEGSRTPDGRIQEFKAGVGHLANETGTPVVPMHIRGAYQIMPRGQKLPLPGPVRVRIGKPMAPQADEGSRQFTARVEKAVRALALEPEQPDIQGTWIERWQAKKPRELRYEESIEPAPKQPQPKMLEAITASEPPPPQSEKPGGRARSSAKTPRASRSKPH
ncbi:MAG: 1-acyl-sn-glycerol-3-phosphate acyltransferase [Chloroflexota bacterium]|jgi:1-acyl-sn-glycerol-3-phosphate acyltransferase|nr:1-acyl-sn-glycerol-3-phosphate acyltransferase [Chloroflexota bacterium]